MTAHNALLEECSKMSVSSGHLVNSLVKLIDNVLDTNNTKVLDDLFVYVNQQGEKVQKEKNILMKKNRDLDKEIMKLNAIIGENTLVSGEIGPLNAKSLKKNDFSQKNCENALNAKKKQKREFLFITLSKKENEINKLKCVEKEYLDRIERVKSDSHDLITKCVQVGAEYPKMEQPRAKLTLCDQFNAFKDYYRDLMDFYNSQENLKDEYNTRIQEILKMLILTEKEAVKLLNKDSNGILTSVDLIEVSSVESLPFQLLFVLHGILNTKISANIEEYNRMTEEIEDISSVYDISDTFSFDKCYSDKYIKMMGEYLKKLKVREATESEGVYAGWLEKYKKCKKEYTKRIKLLGGENSPVPEGNSSIEMEKTFVDLEKPTYKEIKSIRSKYEMISKRNDSISILSDLMLKRKNLLKSMEEFEKIASDPKRLFKSSFQLNKEEKFRKEAYPTLKSLEGEIEKKVEMLEDENLKEKIREEIKHHKINRKIF